jgi:hypothetical protein
VANGPVAAALLFQRSEFWMSDRRQALIRAIADERRLVLLGLIGSSNT